MGIAALILGIISIIIGFVPLCGMIAYFMTNLLLKNELIIEVINSINQKKGDVRHG